MKTITLDASRWRAPKDFYDALLAAIGAPAWHSHNINALLETMIQCDDVNAVSPPYTVRIENVEKASADTREEIAAVQTAFAREVAEIRSRERRDVGVRIQAL